MAGRSGFSGSVIICLLVSQIAVHLFINAPTLPMNVMNGNLLLLSIAQDQSRPQIDSVSSQTKSSSKPLKIAPATKLALVMKLLNFTLIASLVLLANDVFRSLNHQAQRIVIIC